MAVLMPDHRLGLSGKYVNRNGTSLKNSRTFFPLWSASPSTRIYSKSSYSYWISDSLIQSNLGSNRLVQQTTERRTILNHFTAKLLDCGLIIVVAFGGGLDLSNP